ncbi:hypothetical protein DY000_02006100 [Brassica cretica]|uniref:Uncharacterized protein n=1 Tax=Brassica cretica TaxID=69181 RepID=A0ABQ7CIC0_BRACR|nr:hypothetical protein DY000_02006100 [Brassica cretica]
MGLDLHLVNPQNCESRGTDSKRDESKAGRIESGMDYRKGGGEREKKREREKAILRYVAPVMVVSGSMMLPVSQAPSICTGGASSSHHKKFENLLSTEEEDLVPAMEDEVDGEEEKSPSFCRLLRSGVICPFVILCPAGRSAKAYMFCGTGLVSHFEDRSPREPDPLKDEPVAVRDGMGRIIPTSTGAYLC